MTQKMFRLSETIPRTHNRVYVAIIIRLVAVVAVGGFVYNIAKYFLGPPPKIVITDINLDEVYALGASTGGCFPPANQALPDSFSVTPGTVIRENFTLTDVVSNVECGFTTLKVTTAGFNLISLSPSLPWPLSNGSGIAVSLTIQTPNQGYTGPISIELDGSATLEPTG